MCEDPSESPREMFSIPEHMPQKTTGGFFPNNCAKYPGQELEPTCSEEHNEWNTVTRNEVWRTKVNETRLSVGSVGSPRQERFCITLYGNFFITNPSAIPIFFTSAGGLSLRSVIKKRQVVLPFGKKYERT